MEAPVFHFFSVIISVIVTGNQPCDPEVANRNKGKTTLCYSFTSSYLGKAESDMSHWCGYLLGLVAAMGSPGFGVFRSFNDVYHVAPWPAAAVPLH